MPEHTIRVRNGNNSGTYHYEVHTQNGIDIKPSRILEKVWDVRGRPNLREGWKLVEVFETGFDLDAEEGKYFNFIFRGNFSEEALRKRIETVAIRCAYARGEIGRCTYDGPCDNKKQFGAEEPYAHVTLCRNIPKILEEALKK